MPRKKISPKHKVLLLEHKVAGQIFVQYLFNDVYYKDFGIESTGKELQDAAILKSHSTSEQRLSRRGVV